MVITARNIHDWMWTPGRLDKVLSDSYAVLKRGGILAVEEHRADPRLQVPDARDGYVNTAFFNRPGGPSDASLDPAKYQAIGESDRMTLRFRKP